MNTKKMGLLCVVLFTMSLCAENQFIKKKNKIPSMSSLKTDCGIACGDILEHMADLLQEAAKLQRELLKKSRALIEGQSDSFFNNASKEELQASLDKLNALDKKILTFNKEVQDLLSYFKEQ